MSEETQGQDGAPPGDGSHKGSGSEGWKPPTDGSWLPKVAVDELVNRHKDRASAEAAEAARLRAENEALKAHRAAADKPKPLTRTELNQLVADGKVTQEAADAEWERQVVDTATSNARQAARDEGAQRELEQTISAQLEEYRGLIPEAWEAGSKERARVAKEFRYLTEKLGSPNSQATEIAALRAAFGDPEAIKASRSTGRHGPAETHGEVGGAERGEGATKDGDGAPKGLDARQKAHYEKLIAQGHYPDWKAVREELKFSRPKAARA